MIKFSTVFTSAILVLLLIAFGAFLVRDKPGPTSVARDSVYEAAIVPPEYSESAPSRSLGDASSAETEATVRSSDERAAPSGDDSAQAAVDVSGQHRAGADTVEEALPSSRSHARQEPLDVMIRESVPAQVAPSDAPESAGTPIAPDTADRKNRVGHAAVSADPAIASSDQPPRTYRVRSGDNLASIARSLFGESNRWTAIADANPSVNPLTLRVGQVLQLPTSPVVEQMPQELSGAAPVVHRVRAGDSLSSIAEKYYGNPALWMRIRDANTEVLGRGVRQIPVGQQLTIPQLDER